MRIAVASENGSVFQHFGKSPEFTMYDVETELVQHKEIIPTNGASHGQIADFLVDNGADIVICGGMGSGAKTALRERRIEIVPGVKGEVDDIIVRYLSGEKIQSFEAECNHHSHNSEGGCGSDGGCGSH